MRRLGSLRGRIVCVAVVMLLAMLLPAQVRGAAAAAPRDGGNDGNGLAVVVIRNFGFHPAILAIQHNTTVLWINTDRVAHTVTADNGSFSSGVIRPGGIFVHTFNMDGHDGGVREGDGNAGTNNAFRDDGNGGRDDNNPIVVSYHCAIHPFMHAAVIVNS